MNIGTQDVRCRLLAGVAVVVLAAGCTGTASLATPPSSKMPVTISAYVGTYNGPYFQRALDLSFSLIPEALGE